MVTFEELLIDPLLEKVKEVMNEHKKGDDPVHPIIIDDASTKQVTLTGISKRELISAMCLQGLLSTLTIERDAHSRFLAETAVLHADALLQELSKERE